MEFVLHPSACRHDARFKPSDETGYFNTAPIGARRAHLMISRRRARFVQNGQLPGLRRNGNLSLSNRGKQHGSGRSACGALDFRTALENASDKLLLGESSNWLREPILSVMPRIQKTEFRKVNYDRVLGDCVGRMSAQNKTEHPDRSSAWLNHKSSQRDFENPRKLLNYGLDVHPRSLQAHCLDLHFGSRPSTRLGGTYQENTICKAFKLLQLKTNFDFIEQINASDSYLCPTISSARRSEKIGRGDLLAMHRRSRILCAAHRKTFAKTNDAKIDIGSNVGAVS